MNNDHSGEGLACRRVLVVDDNQDLAESFRNLLEFFGCVVDVAHDGSEGLRLALSAKYDVIFLDIALPRMNGYEVARAIRAIKGGEVLLVAQTAYGAPEDRRLAMEAGFDDHLTKPAEPELLLRHAVHPSLLGDSSRWSGPKPMPSRGGLR